MRYTLKLAVMVFALGFIFVSVDTVNAQSRQRKAQREYREDVRDAKKDYREDIRDGKSRREASRDYREDVRDARREYRSDTNRRVNRGYYNSNRRYSRSTGSRYYYYNGRLYRRW